LPWLVLGYGVQLAGYANSAGSQATLRKDMPVPTPVALRISARPSGGARTAAETFDMALTGTLLDLERGGDRGADRRRFVAGLIAALVTIAGWTGWTLATRHAMAIGSYPFSAMELATLRFGTAAVVFLPAWGPLVLRHGLKPAFVSWPVFLALFGAGLPFALVVGTGFRLAPASDAAPLITGTLPLITAAGATLVLGERFGLGRRIGLGLIGVGALAVLVDAVGRGALGGDGLFLLGALMWACYALAFRLSGLTPIAATGLVALWSFVAAAPFGLPSLVAAVEAGAGAALLGQLFFQGIVSGVVSILAYTLAVAWLGAARATALTAVVPVTAGLAAIAFLGEAVSVTAAAGATVTVLGVLFASGAVKGPFGRP
jgi:drug/metabolite transporter (DMT)-like permease